MARAAAAGRCIGGPGREQRRSIVSDELGKRIDERLAKERARVEAAAAQRRRAEEIAQEVPGQWAGAIKGLYEAITAASRTFAEKGLQHRYFKPQPLRSPKFGNHARILIYHNDTGLFGSISQTVITVGLDGQVTVRHRSFSRAFAVSHIKREDWDVLLADIYEHDLPA